MNETSLTDDQQLKILDAIAKVTPDYKWLNNGKEIYCDRKTHIIYITLHKMTGAIHYGSFITDNLAKLYNHRGTLSTKSLGGHINISDPELINKIKKYLEETSIKYHD